MAAVSKFLQRIEEEMNAGNNCILQGRGCVKSVIVCRE